MDLTDKQWEVLEPLIPEPPRRVDDRGRPWRDAREVLNAILWILRTGAPWGTTCPIAILPTRPAIGGFSGGSRRACSQASLKSSEDLEEHGGLDLSECFIDGTFVVAKKGDHQ